MNKNITPTNLIITVQSW